jgi:hypothetical protein
MAGERKLILDGVPDNLVVNPVISVPQKVSHPAKTLPIRPGRDLFGIPAKKGAMAKWATELIIKRA